MKQNVSVPIACEMEKKRVEVTARRAGAHYVPRVEQCQAHVGPSTTFDLNPVQGRGLWVSLCHGVGEGQGELGAAF